MPIRVAAAEPDGSHFRDVKRYPVRKRPGEGRFQLAPLAVGGVQSEAAIAPDLLAAVPWRFFGEVRAAGDEERVVDDGDEGTGDTNGIGNGRESGPIQERAGLGDWGRFGGKCR